MTRRRSATAAAASSATSRSRTSRSSTPASRGRSRISMPATRRSAWRCCSTSAAAWRSAATSTAPAKPSRWRCTNLRDAAATRRRSSPSTRSCRKSCAFTTGSRSRAPRQPRGQAVGHDVALRRDRADGRSRSPRATNRHRALLVITDGVDTGSRLTAAAGVGDRQRDRRARVSADRGQPARPPGRRICGPRGRQTTAQTATLADLARWTGGDMRIASVPAHTRRGDPRSVRGASPSIPHHLRAGHAAGLAPARDSYAEEEPDRSRAERVHVGPVARNGS